MDPIKLYDTTVTNSHLILGHKDHTSSSSIVRSHVSSSEIELIGGGRTLTLIDSSFDRCSVTGKKANRFFLSSASWTDCVFRGRFHDCVFGHGTDGEKIEIRNCDFSQADLDASFRGGLHFESCKFAPWPTVVFARHQLDMPALKTCGLPPRLLTMITPWDDDDEEWCALDVTRYDDSELDLYCVLKDQQGVHFHDAPFPAEPTPPQIEAARQKYLEQMRKYQLYRFWGWITQSVSITSVEFGPTEGAITLKTGNKPHIELPPTFRVRLLGLTRMDVAKAEFLLQVGNKKTFRLMGSTIADDFNSVSLKGHSKALGRIGLSYAAMKIETCDGSNEPIQALAEWQHEQ